MLTSTIVVGVQSMHSVKFLTIVLILLLIWIQRSISISIWRTEWIVVCYLLNHTFSIHHLMVITKMILVVIVECKLVCSRACNRCLSISAIKEEHVYLTILHSKTTAKEIIR